VSRRRDLCSIPLLSFRGWPPFAAADPYDVDVPEFLFEIIPFTLSYTFLFYCFLSRFSYTYISFSLLLLFISSLSSVCLSLSSSSVPLLTILFCLSLLSFTFDLHSRYIILPFFFTSFYLSVFFIIPLVFILTFSFISFLHA
jgi:hypothetical protein